MTALLQYASLLCVGAGLISGALALLAGRDALAGLRVALDFWLAAGLLRLAEPNALTTLLGVAIIIAVRQVVVAALRAR
ncbi:hypothetical protein HH310_16895 [Actinoplanes sp. TBRC 11911]|uniref:hypothetical protein n=1 Tax=Actinoplanes sp. TBRC 11911 TaxID=2729386 RepID=UPI00145D4BDC|nr:hypothetical protein [Actinoplanes sp. TBRC 11911]NMO52862.1 hypothetical protein [Actinoplanes sp. TBRC 11911]